MLRKTVLGAVVLYMIAVGLFAVLLLRSRPAAGGIPEIGIGARDADGGVVYISGRRLECDSLSGDARVAVRCGLAIDGDPLTIEAGPDTMLASIMARDCEATFRGQSYSCRPELRRGTVRTIVHIQEPLGLEPAELEALRGRYWVENGRFPDVPFIALVTALVATVGVVAWKPLRTDSRKGLMGYAVFGSFVFIFSCVLLFWLSLHLWN